MKHPLSLCLATVLLLPLGLAAQEDGDANAPEEITTHEDAGQQVEEIRIRGRLTEVRVKPETGPEYFIQDRGGDGTLSGKGGGEMDAGINIRTWKIGEW